MINYFMRIIDAILGVDYKENNLMLKEDLYSHKRLIKKQQDIIELYESELRTLERNQLKQNSTGQFTDSEIKSLISLCHPDKHNGKASATNITQKLLKMRK